MMKHVHWIQLVLGMLMMPTALSAQIGTEFIYQGELADGGTPAGGNYDFRFTLWDAATSGGSHGPALEFDANGAGTVAVADGIFTVELDFGDEFGDEPRWLQIEVRHEDPGDTQPYSTLSPRVEVLAVPQAIYARRAGDAATLEGSAFGDFILMSVYDSDGNGVVDSADNVDDADPVTGNEYNTSLTYSAGNGMLELTDAGGTVGTTLNALSAEDGDPAPVLWLDNDARLLYQKDALNTAVGIEQNHVGGASTMELTTADASGNQATRLLLRGNTDTADIEFYSGARGAETKYAHLEGTTGYLGVGVDNPQVHLDVEGDIYGQEYLRVRNSSDEVRALIQALADDAGQVALYGPNGALNVRAYEGNLATRGDVSVHDSAGTRKGRMYVDADGGALRLDAAADSGRVELGFNSSDSPSMAFRGPNGNVNVWFDDAPSGLTNHGYIDVRDSNGTNQAFMSWDASGANGGIEADSKSFVIDHPVHPGMKLEHGCVEGAELAVVYHGEGVTEAGSAVVTLPDYFEALTRAEGRTVRLTCRDGYSPLHVAGAVENGAFRVISEGAPDQAFYWEVKAVRADVGRLVVEIPANVTRNAAGEASPATITLAD